MFIYYYFVVALYTIFLVILLLTAIHQKIDHFHNS
jgi:hypothetical protein